MLKTNAGSQCASWRIILPTITMLSLVVAIDASGADKEGEVRIISDSLQHNQKNDTVRATGNVEVEWKGSTLTADEVEYSQKTEDASATGHVRLRSDSEELVAEQMTINLLTQRGVALNGSLMTRDGNLRVKGARMEKLGESEYRLSRGSFTTCDAVPPSWEFTASDLDVTLEGYAVGRNVVFSVADLPVFYTPYIIFPAKTERQSGLLFPRFGNSSRNGFILDIPYYWAVSPSAEVTFDLDIRTSRGYGAGANIAYLRPGGSYGNVKAYAVYDKEMERVRSTLGAKAKEIIGPTVDFNADVSIVSDRSFHRDYGEVSGEYNRQALDSSVSLTKRWESWYAAGEVRLIDDLDSSLSKQTLQRLPEVTITGTGMRLGSLPLYAGLKSRVTNFSRREGVEGQRMIFQPTVAWHADLPDGLTLGGWGGYQQRLYHGYGGAGDGNAGLGLGLAGAEGTATFMKVYETGGTGLTRIRHMVTPGVGYSFVEDKAQERVSFFDYDDRVPGQNLVNWSLTNVLNGRFDSSGPEYRELLLMRLSQGYQLSGGRRDLLNGADSGDRFTDLRVEAVANPVKQFALDLDTRFSTSRGEVTTTSLGARVNDEHGNSAGLGYRRIAGEMDYLQGGLTLALLKPFYLNLTERYSFERKDFLEQYYALEYRHQCWSVMLSYRDRPGNNEFMVNFSLAGIGNTGKVN